MQGCCCIRGRRWRGKKDGINASFSLSPFSRPRLWRWCMCKNRPFSLFSFLHPLGLARRKRGRGGGFIEPCGRMGKREIFFILQKSRHSFPGKKDGKFFFSMSSAGFLFSLLSRPLLTKSRGDSAINFCCLFEKKLRKEKFFPFFLNISSL